MFSEASQFQIVQLDLNSINFITQDERYYELSIETMPLLTTKSDKKEVKTLISNKYYLREEA